MKTFLTTAAVGALMIAGVAVAQGQTPAPPPPPKPPLSKAEMLARADARFDRLDTNKDGQLSVEERKAGMERARAAMAGPERKGGELQDFAPGRRGGGDMAERMMARADTNGDGLISKAEYRAMAEARYDRMQAGEGRMGRRGPGPEGAAMPGAMPGPGAMRDPDGPHGPGHKGPGHKGGGMMRADANKDGVITRAEYDAMAAQRFDALDANKDGRIDAAELQMQRDKMREKMQARRDRPTPPPPPPAPQGA